MTLYLRIALVHPQRLPHKIAPTDELTDVAGIETDRGIQIVTSLGIVLLPWSQVAHTLVALDEAMDHQTPPPEVRSAPIPQPPSPMSAVPKRSSPYASSPKARR
jgi:hypothetical protein